MEACKYRPVISSEQEAHVKFRWRILLRQLLICAPVWTLNFTWGLGIGAPTVFIPQFRAANISVSDNMASWLSSSISYSSIPWCIVAPLCAEVFGRKRVYFLASLSLFGSYIIFYFSTSVVQILVSQICLGLVAACPMTISVTLLTEYTSPKYRGIFLPLKCSSLCWGIWIANVVGTLLPWKFIGILGICSALFNLATIVWWPESPYWLASKQRFAECQNTHRWLKGGDADSEKELNDLIRLHQTSSHPESERISDVFNVYKKTVKSKEFIKPLLLSNLVACLYNFCGKLVCSVYAIDVLKKITGSESRAYSGMLILDGVTVAGMYTGSVISRFVKRRTLLFPTICVVIVCLFSLSLYIYLISISVITENGLISIGLLSTYSLAVGCGPMIITTTFFSEMVPLKLRGLALIFSGLLFMSSTGTLLKTAPFMLMTIKLHGLFLFYGTSSAIITLLLYKYLPETKDKSLISILDDINS